jgi:uncharacterized protein YqfA (UPF0365 family)
MSNSSRTDLQQNVAEMKVAEPTKEEKAAAAAQYEIERKARMDQHRAEYNSMTPEQRAEAYRTGNMEGGGYRKKSRKGKKSKRRNTRRRRGLRSRKHRMR